jgi:hypothetical protein
MEGELYMDAISARVRACGRRAGIYQLCIWQIECDPASYLERSLRLEVRKRGMSHDRQNHYCCNNRSDQYSHDCYGMVALKKEKIALGMMILPGAGVKYNR